MSIFSLESSLDRALIALFLVRILCARFASIGDCDEVYNYWEVVHYWIFGDGFQTWEYHEDYAIRSYLYILLYALPGALLKAVFSLAGREVDKITLFYLLRFFTITLPTFYTEYLFIMAVRTLENRYWA